jgi:hypothetical protein
MHGFDDDNVEQLEQGLLRIAREETVTFVHGTKFIIRGELATPTGGTVELETVWIVETNDAPPRFVTAYPG